MTIDVTVTPSEDRELVAAARDLLVQLGTQPPVAQEDNTSERTRDGAIAAYAALVLALPGTLVALAQLRDMLSSGQKRIALSERIEPTLEVARAKSAAGKSLVIRLDGRPLDLGDVGVDDVLDALADYEESKREGKV